MRGWRRSSRRELWSAKISPAPLRSWRISCSPRFASGNRLPARSRTTSRSSSSTSFDRAGMTSGPARRAWPRVTRRTCDDGQAVPTSTRGDRQGTAWFPAVPYRRCPAWHNPLYANIGIGQATELGRPPTDRRSALRGNSQALKPRECRTGSMRAPAGLERWVPKRTPPGPPRLPAYCRLRRSLRRA